MQEETLKVSKSWYGHLLEITGRNLQDRPGGGDLTVSDHLDDFCGVMAGVRVTANKATWMVTSF